MTRPSRRWGPAGLTGRVAVVTGAARGLGAAVAQRLAAQGMTVALLGLEADELARQAERCGPSARWWEVDVTDEAALHRVADEVAATLGRAGVVVANAGIAAGGPFRISDPGSFDRVLEVNLLGSVRTARAFLPHLEATGGYLLQIASMAALAPTPTMAAYCASKSGVEAFAHALSFEVAHHGVGVGIAYLSWTDTDMVRGADAVEALARNRAALPPPLNRTYPLAQAADTLVAGIAARRAHVYAPGWVRVPAAVRAAIPALMGPVARRRAARVEEAVIRSGGAALTGPVGAGGEADLRARRARNP